MALLPRAHREHDDTNVLERFVCDDNNNESEWGKSVHSAED